MMIKEYDLRHIGVGDGVRLPTIKFRPRHNSIM